MKNNKDKVIVVIGPTAAGKTKLGVYLADIFNGEIISADSRQVYKGMDIGTGKDLKDYIITKKIKGQEKRIKIKYHLLDVVSPKTEYNLAKYVKQANLAIQDVLKRKKLPIIVGGTGLYIQALIDNYDLKPVKPDKALRKELESQNLKQLLAVLRKIDNNKYKSLNQSEKLNKRRLIRYIEISQKEKPKTDNNKKEKRYNTLILAPSWPRKIIVEKIDRRLIERIEKEGMIKEVQKLHKNGVSWKRLENFGLEYKHVSWYLQGKMEYAEMVEKLKFAIRQFSKRQMTWFRRWQKQGTKIYWLNGIDKKISKKLVENFLKQ